MSQAARHLQIPRTTLHSWVKDGQHALVHRVAEQPHGWPTIPFTVVVEAQVLRVLRHELTLSMPKVRPWPTVVRLQQYEGIAPVVVDPRFAWGQPVVEQDRVFVAAVYDLWRAGDEMSTIAEEFDLIREPGGGSFI